VERAQRRPVERRRSGPAEQRTYDLDPEKSGRTLDRPGGMRRAKHECPASAGQGFGEGRCGDAGAAGELGLGGRRAFVPLGRKEVDGQSCALGTGGREAVLGTVRDALVLAANATVRGAPFAVRGELILSAKGIVAVLSWPSFASFAMDRSRSTRAPFAVGLACAGTVLRTTVRGAAESAPRTVRGGIRPVQQGCSRPKPRRRTRWRGVRIRAPPPAPFAVPACQ
jgi:hypothetical protein